MAMNVIVGQIMEDTDLDKFAEPLVQEIQITFAVDPVLTLSIKQALKVRNLIGVQCIEWQNLSQRLLLEPAQSR